MWRENATFVCEQKRRRMKLRFWEKKERGFSRPSTASVPAVVFLFLLFLMASTVMRETVLNVQRAEGSPQSPQMRLQRAQTASFVYLARADTSYAPSYRTREGYVLLFNDSYATPRQIDDFIKAEKGFAARQGRLNVVFRIKPDAAVGQQAQQAFKESLERALEKDTIPYRTK